MGIVNQRQKILGAMESNARITMILLPKLSTENVEGKSSSLKKNVKEVRRNNQTYFFFKLSPWETSLKITSSGKL